MSITGKPFALVFPADQEPLGLCILEAMATGMPVIASGSDGIPEIVVHERTALLVTPSDPHALAHAILRMISEPGLRERLSAKGLQYLRQQHSLADYAGSVASLYEKLLV